VLRQLAVFGLFEAFGEAQQAQVGFAEFGEVGVGPFAALQALPDLKNLTCLDEITRWAKCCLRRSRLGSSGSVIS